MPSTAKFIDITRPMDPGMGVWPGDPPFEMEWTSLRATGDPVNVARLRLGLHTGTHVDAPYHVLDGGARIDGIPLDVFVGPATVADCTGCEAIGEGPIGRALERTPRPTRLLIRTGVWEGSDRFPGVIPGFEAGAVALLIEAGVRLIGTDAPSVDPIDSDTLPAHHGLLSAGICIVENLLLDRVEPGDYELIALPLRIRDGDASPVRAVLWR